MLSRKELTMAVNAYAKRYGYSVSTVRDCTSLRVAAICSYVNKRNQIVAMVVDNRMAQLDPRELSY